MITKNEIDSYISKIPPPPTVLLETVSLLRRGELTKAAQVAKADMALGAYLKTLVNSPIYGFRDRVEDITQIFAIFGVAMSNQIVYSYMISLLSPDKWELFTLDKKKFYSLQANLSKRWELILNHINIKDKEIFSSIALLPASIIVAEALFKLHKKEVTLLKEVKNLDYNTILKRLAGMDLFDISAQIAQKCELPSKAYNIVLYSDGTKTSEDKELLTLAKWMHLLLFYELSQRDFANSGLNDFIEFNIDFVGDIYSDFAALLELS